MKHIIDTDELEKLLSAVTIDTFAGEPYVTGLTEIYALIANSPQADGIVLAPSEYRLDYSTGTPILMHKDCSVIEGNEAVAIFGLLSAYKPLIDVVKQEGKL